MCHIALSVLQRVLKMSPPAEMQAVDVDATRQHHVQ